MLSLITTDDGSPAFLIKGGKAIEARVGIPASRASKDFDSVFRKSFEQVQQAITDAIQEPVAHFSATVGKVEQIKVPDLDVAPLRFTIKLSYHGRPWETVPIEVSAAEAGLGEEFDLVQSTSFAQIGLEVSSELPCMSLRYQIATKLHACTEVLELPKINSRARDLVDLQILFGIYPGSNLKLLEQACVEIFAERAKQPWPPKLVPPASWQATYLAERDDVLEAEEMGLAVDVNAALQTLEAIIAEIAANGA